MQDIVVYSITSGSLFLLTLVTFATPRKVNGRANYWLGLFLFSFACILLDRVFLDAHLYDEYPMATAALELTRLAMSPALYFSVLYFTVPSRSFTHKDYWHFVPFGLFMLFALLVVTGINDSAMFSWYYTLPAGLRKAVGLTVFVFLKVQMIVYWFLAYRQLMKHASNVKLFASTIEPISLSWLRYFLLGLAVALLLSLNERLGFLPVLVPLTNFGYLFLAFYLGYFSLRQQEIYPYRPKDVVAIREIIEAEPKTNRTSRFSDGELSSAKLSLVRLMDTEKLFLDSNLGLPQLALKMQMSTHDLSFLINEGFGENFFQFINRYRIDEAKRLLKSGQHNHLSILGIAFESGFSSKSTFNSTFKKLTGVSPSQFMQTPNTPDEKAA